jgi:hypothetical protein
MNEHICLYSCCGVIVIEKILRSMTHKYDYVMCYIEESNNLDVLTIDEL